MNTLILDASCGELRVMLLSSEGEPIEIRLGEPEEQAEGAVYLARVERISPRLNAAFVDIGTEKNAFLPMEHKDALKMGSFLPVQGVARQENGDKGFRVRRDLQLSGRLLVYLPEGGKVRCSSRIADPDERKRLTELAGSLLTETEGAVLRTAAQGASKEDLSEEIASLRERMREIASHAETRLRPGLLWRPSPSEQILSTYASQEVGRIVTNDEALMPELRAAARKWIPGAEIQFFSEDRTLLCDAFGLDEAIRKALHRKLYTPSGGTVIVDLCEAMTVYDVNSGGSDKGRDPEEAALLLNLEAARLIARHLRLTGIGGIVMIDFIDMRKKENRDLVLAEMRGHMKNDPAASEVYAIGPLGIMQLSRKRTGLSLHRLLRSPCHTCGGQGTEPSDDWREADRKRAERRAALSGAERD